MGILSRHIAKEKIYCHHKTFRHFTSVLAQEGIIDIQYNNNNGKFNFAVKCYIAFYFSTNICYILNLHKIFYVIFLLWKFTFFLKITVITLLVTYGWSCSDNSQPLCGSSKKILLTCENISSNLIGSNMFLPWELIPLVLHSAEPEYYITLLLYMYFYLDSTQKQWFYCKCYIFVTYQHFPAMTTSKCQISNSTTLKWKNFLSMCPWVMRVFVMGYWWCCYR